MLEGNGQRLFIYSVKCFQAEHFHEKDVTAFIKDCSASDCFIHVSIATPWEAQGTLFSYYIFTLF